MRRRMIAWLAAGVIALGGLGLWAAWTVRLGQYSRTLSLQLEAERQRNFAELIGHVQSIQGLLGKGLAAGTVRQNMFYLSEVYRRSSLATSNFMALPLTGPVGTSTGKFLNQVGDFSFSIARSESAGRAMDAQQRAELQRLQQVSATLATDLEKVGQQATKDRFRWVGSGPRLAELFSGWRQQLRAPGTKPSGSQAPKNLMPAGLDKIGAQMDRMPVMVYDGPFSDHLQKRTPAMGGAQLTEPQARERALGFVPHLNTYTVAQSTKRNGRPPVYTYRLAPKAGQPYTTTLDVTVAGGHLISFNNSRPATTPKLTLDQAKQAGLTYLQQHGFASMVPTYGEVANGFATVQYALNHRGVIVYPDQVKVRVALDDGEIVGVDARAYVMSHKDRGTIPVPAITQAQAATALNPEMKVSRTRLAMIPTETGDQEVLTYEFMGTLGNNTFLVYVNAQTGAEERILQMLISANGTLAL